jgi:hypothetical protein
LNYLYRGGDFYFLLFLLLINIHVTKIWYKIADMNRERGRERCGDHKKNGYQLRAIEL